MHTEQRTQPITLGVVHVNVGPENVNGAAQLQTYLNSIKAGYHVVIDNNKKLITADDNLVVWGAPYVNPYAKHYCLVGQASQTAAEWLDAYSRGELDLLAQSLADDCKKYNLAPRRLSPAEVSARVKGICGHIDVTNAFKARGLAERPPIILDHWDPGPNFPWALLISMVNSLMTGAGETSMKRTDRTRVAISRNPATDARYLLGADGGVFCFGAAQYQGSLPELVQQKKATALDMNKDWALDLLLTPSERGYWILTRLGSVLSFGDAKFLGTFHKVCNDSNPMVGLVPSGGSGYMGMRYDGQRFAGLPG